MTCSAAGLLMWVVVMVKGRVRGMIFAYCRNIFYFPFLLFSLLVPLTKVVRL